MILIFSSLCGNIFEEGTLLEVGSLSAQDWKDVDLELESLLLKQSAKLIADSILSNGKKGLDLTYAVRSWRTLRHLTEVIVALVTKSGCVQFVAGISREDYSFGSNSFFRLGSELSTSLTT